MASAVPLTMARGGVPPLTDRTNRSAMPMGGAKLAGVPGQGRLLGPRGGAPGRTQGFVPSGLDGRPANIGPDGKPKDPDKLEETIEREELEKRLEISTTWSKVWQIEAATAKLKLARMESEPQGVQERMMREIDVCACDLKVKTLEENMCMMREEELKNMLKESRAKEVEALSSKLQNLNSMIKTVQAFPQIVSDPNRRRFFYSDCHQQWGLGKFYCQVLEERPEWERYPDEKWFITDNGTQLYSPMGKVTVDFSDQSVYSTCASNVYGTEHLSNKGKFAKLIPSFLPPTWHIDDQKWGAGGAAPSGDFKMWFLKETTRNYGTGIGMFPTAAKAFAAAQPGKQYVLQPHYKDPMLLDPKNGMPSDLPSAVKFHVRVYMFLHSPADKLTVTGYLCKGHAWVNMASRPFSYEDFSVACQVTRDRSLSEKDWSLWPTVYGLCREKAAAVVQKLQPKLEVQQKASFELFGIDFIFTKSWETKMYEINAGPCVKDAEKPMMHHMLNIACPKGCVPVKENMWEPIGTVQARLKKQPTLPNGAVPKDSRLPAALDPLGQRSQPPPPANASALRVVPGFTPLHPPVAPASPQMKAVSGFTPLKATPGFTPLVQ